MRYEIALHKHRVHLGSVAWNGDYESAKERAFELLSEREDATRVTVTDRLQKRVLFSLVR